jgi:hypothetical protein
MALPPSRRGGRDRFRMLRQDRGEPVYQNIPAERGLDRKQIRDRCHHRDADRYWTMRHHHVGPDHAMNWSTVETAEPSAQDRRGSCRCPRGDTLHIRTRLGTSLNRR